MRQKPERQRLIEAAFFQVPNPRERIAYPARLAFWRSRISISRETVNRITKTTVSQKPNVRTPAMLDGEGNLRAATRPQAIMIPRYATLRRLPESQWPPRPRDSRYSAISMAFSSLRFRPVPIDARKKDALITGVCHESIRPT